MPVTARVIPNTTNMPMDSSNWVFVDSNIYVASFDDRDPTHSKAVELEKKITDLNLKPLTSSNIISECLTIISQKLGKPTALKFLKGLGESETEILFVDELIYNQALELFPKIKSKNVSFADCTSFTIMKNRGVKVAFTFDQHFKTQGFKLLGE